ncbi:hypothetical protein [Enterobacter hormaechei]|uniref:hypothetical protein n=1 Tax=Enterobacter hormaechei TaxID=158836 RepID=UPI002FEE7400
MNVNKQFFWFLMNAVLMCIFIIPVAVAFWLSAFAAGFDWGQWVNLAADAASRAASDPAKALGTVQTYWGILSFFLLAAYSLLCSGQLKLATALDFFQYRFSDSFGGNPPL